MRGARDLSHWKVGVEKLSSKREEEMQEGTKGKIEYPPIYLTGKPRKVRSKGGHRPKSLEGEDTTKEISKTLKYEAAEV